MAKTQQSNEKKLLNQKIETNMKMGARFLKRITGKGYPGMQIAMHMQ